MESLRMADEEGIGRLVFTPLGIKRIAGFNALYRLPQVTQERIAQKVDRRLPRSERHRLRLMFSLARKEWQKVARKCMAKRLRRKREKRRALLARETKSKARLQLIIFCAIRRRQSDKSLSKQDPTPMHR